MHQILNHFVWGLVQFVVQELPACLGQTDAKSRCPTVISNVLEDVLILCLVALRRNPAYIWRFLQNHLDVLYSSMWAYGSPRSDKTAGIVRFV